MGCCVILGMSGSYVAMHVMDILGHFEIFWDILGRFWDILEQFEIFCDILWHFEIFWDILSNFDLYGYGNSSAAKPGQNQYYQLTYCNNGFQTIDGTLVFTHDPLLTGFDLMASGATSYDPVTFTATWDFEDLSFFECVQIMNTYYILYILLVFKYISTFECIQKPNTFILFNLFIHVRGSYIVRRYIQGLQNLEYSGKVTKNHIQKKLFLYYRLILDHWWFSPSQ